MRHFIDQQRKESNKPPPLPLALPDDPRLRTLSVRPTTSPTTTTSTTNPTAPTRSNPVTTTTNKTTATESDSVRQRLRDVALYGLAAQDHALLTEPWVERVIDIEDRERKRRSLERRLTNARIGAFKPIADFDWTWPKRIDQLLIEELFSLAFVHDATNIVLVGPNGVGKTMLIKNPPPSRRPHGFTARFTTASDMLHELAAQDSDASLARRLRRFTGPQLLAIDEVGYLNYDNRYADLLFEVVTRRYLTVPILLTTNKPFSEWAEVFSSAACVVTLVDRLIHRSEIVQLDGESYRLREAKEQAAKRSKGPLAPNRQIPCIARTALMNHQPPPLIAVPLDLSDEAAAKLTDFLLATAHQLENYYSEQLYRYHNGIDERQPDLWSDTDPPF